MHIFVLVVCGGNKVASVSLVSRSLLIVALTGMPAVAVAQQQPAASTQPAQTAAISSEPAGLFDEPRILTKGIELGRKYLAKDDLGRVDNGFYPELGNMVTGAGWISVGPGYRHWLLDDRALFDASAAISWRAYKMAQATLELPHLMNSRVVLGTQARWHDLTQVTYFGEGPDSLDTNRSEYRLQSGNLVGYASVRPADWTTFNGRVGWLTGPTLGPPTGAFMRGNPHTREVFPADPVYQLGEQPAFLYGEVSVVHDTRNASGYPSSGGIYRASWAQYADQGAEAFSFRRYEAEAAHFVPLASRNVVLALHGWLVTSDAADGHQVPFYLLPSLGGASTLRSYPNYRFHDRNLAVVNLETRVALFSHVDVALLLDAGNVAARVSDLNLDRTSYGVGVRVHARGSTFARLDIAHGGEGWQVLFKVSDPFRFGRLARRTAPVPFAP